jgi:hypothetical protein
MTAQAACPCVVGNTQTTLVFTTLILRAGERFTAVGQVPDLKPLEQDPRLRIVKGLGRTLMSGLGDGHAHFSWNDGYLERLGDLGVEEHTLVTAKSAKSFLDSGYTM